MTTSSSSGTFPIPSISSSRVRYHRVQLNMMHVTGDGKRKYVSNSCSTLDHSGRFYVRLVHIGPDGMKVDLFFNIDLNLLLDRSGRGGTTC